MPLKLTHYRSPPLIALKEWKLLCDLHVLTISRKALLRATKYRSPLFLGHRLLCRAISL